MEVLTAVACGLLTAIGLWRLSDRAAGDQRVGGGALILAGLALAALAFSGLRASEAPLRPSAEIPDEMSENAHPPLNEGPPPVSGPLRVATFHPEPARVSSMLAADPTLLALTIVLLLPTFAGLLLLALAERARPGSTALSDAAASAHVGPRNAGLGSRTRSGGDGSQGPLPERRPPAPAGPVPPRARRPASHPQTPPRRPPRGPGDRR